MHTHGTQMMRLQSRLQYTGAHKFIFNKTACHVKYKKLLISRVERIVHPYECQIKIARLQANYLCGLVVTGVRI